ncbi:universal stress protein [Oleisolibacter albus]|uniref:universal stress protein n=1 Tax=Oleisolibacter albus TaxID=2171757 RepID=UPI00138FAAD8|nr:universal stress protein [Oleisolibacter albus]
MPMKTIAVIVDTTDASAGRVRYAALLAARHHAHLVALFVLPPGWPATPADCFARGDSAIQQVIERCRVRQRADIAMVAGQVQATTMPYDIPVEFRVLGPDAASRELPLHCLHADLLVLGEGVGGVATAEGLLLTTGIPVILVPTGWTGSVAESLLIGWNASREARRAVRDAAPLLLAARAVRVLVIDPEKNARHGAEPGADLGLALARQGVKVTVDQMEAAGRPVAEIIRDRARSTAADLIVLGAYSHSRSQQMLFGGVTRSLLRQADLPLLIAH